MLLLAPMSLPMPVSVYSYAKASAYDHASVCSHACAPCTCLCPCVMPNAFAYAHDILPLAARYPLCWLFCELQFRINYTIWNYLLLAMNQYVFSFRIYDSIFINLYTFIASNYCFGTKYEILRVAYSNTVRSLHTHIPSPCLSPWPLPAPMSLPMLVLPLDVSLPVPMPMCHAQFLCPWYLASPLAIIPVDAFANQTSFAIIQ